MGGTMNRPSDALAQVSATSALPSIRASRYAHNAKAENTRKAYRIDWVETRNRLKQALEPVVHMFGP